MTCMLGARFRLLVALLGGVSFCASALADPTLPLPRVPVCGDEDGAPPLLERCGDFNPEADLQILPILPGLLLGWLFDFVLRDPLAHGDFGFFPVDDLDGTVAGLRPGDP